MKSAEDGELLAAVAQTFVRLLHVGRRDDPARRRMASADRYYLTVRQKPPSRN